MEHVLFGFLFSLGLLLVGFVFGCQFRELTDKSFQARFDEAGLIAALQKVRLRMRVVRDEKTKKKSNSLLDRAGITKDKNSYF